MTQLGNKTTKSILSPFMNPGLPHGQSPDSPNVQLCGRHKGIYRIETVLGDSHVMWSRYKIVHHNLQPNPSFPKYVGIAKRLVICLLAMLSPFLQRARAKKSMSNGLVW